MSKGLPNTHQLTDSPELELNPIMKGIRDAYWSEAIRLISKFETIPSFSGEVAMRVLAQIPSIPGKNNEVMLASSIRSMGASWLISPRDSKFHMSNKASNDQT